MQVHAIFCKDCRMMSRRGELPSSDANRECDEDDMCCRKESKDEGEIKIWGS